MKYILTLSSVLFFLCLAANHAPVIAAARFSSELIKTQEVTVSSKLQQKLERKKAMLEKKLASKTGKKKGWLAGIIQAPAKWFQKKMDKISELAGKKFLLWCGIFLLGAIVFFALNSLSPVFGYLGSGAAIVSAIFFVLWLLEFAKTKGVPEL